ncbi:hypothetical protein SRHO_G00059100 [Serrasalmus rhombeus]
MWSAEIEAPQCTTTTACLRNTPMPPTTGFAHQILLKRKPQRAHTLPVKSCTLFAYKTLFSAAFVHQ